MNGIPSLSTIWTNCAQTTLLCTPLLSFHLIQNVFTDSTSGSLNKEKYARPIQATRILGALTTAGQCLWLGPLALRAWRVSYQAGLKATICNPLGTLYESVGLPLIIGVSLWMGIANERQIRYDNLLKKMSHTEHFSATAVLGLVAGWAILRSAKELSGYAK